MNGSGCQYRILAGAGHHRRRAAGAAVAFLNVYPEVSLVGVMSAVFAAIAYLSVNKLSKRHHNYEIVFYFLF